MSSSPKNIPVVLFYFPSSQPRRQFPRALLQSLTLAKEYAQDHLKPFPEIDDKILQDRNRPKDDYVFERKEKKPTVMYMPLSNRENHRGL